ncbi:MAG: ankyrin repeat domain-containing protein, partial [Nocardioidaceae bacterium]
MNAPGPDRAAELVAAIHSGDVAAGQRVVAGAPELVTGPLGGRFKTRTALHVVADWPGYFPNGTEIVELLIAAGADPNFRDTEPGSETSLHWAASSDDVEVATALIDG